VPSSTAGRPPPRRLDIVRADPDAFGPGAPIAKAPVRRIVVVGGSFLGRGLRLLGAHFTAFVWTTESGDPDRGHGPRRL
jgi:hypothetical protein